ncbi:Co2+/Mg2+ efflux protein ApaG [bacterium SCSIO 12741]|nr:Co2+/Mg2+ efflux protein ApaG [bacterium SCSIO 12741]
MISLTTSGIKVDVKSYYLEKNSEPESGQFLFAYDISITNHNDFSVQLLKRHWIIYDSLFPKREVRGNGVIGEQPILTPGECYRYQSYCDLHSSMGWMEGSYLFRKEEYQHLMEVNIPRFELILPNKLN